MMFSVVIELEWRADNLTKCIDRIPEEKRKRYLKHAELQRLGAALTASKNRQSANAIRLLLLTGARCGELLKAEWKEIDFELGTWTKPSSHTKQNKEHIVRLSAPALQLLSEIYDAAEADTKYVFPGRDGDGPQTYVRTAWETIREEAGIPEVRLHDLRHSFASILASSGETLLTIGELLGHSNPATTARYAHLFQDKQHAASEKVGRFVMDALKPTGETAELIPLKRRR
jgi:integrase